MITIEAARTQDGREPVEEFLAKLLKSRRKRRYLAEVMILFEDWARLGDFNDTLRQRELRDDLWEVKTSHLRFPYYELRDEHGRVARLTHGFDKEFGKTVDGKAPRKHFDRGLWGIEEDRQC